MSTGVLSPPFAAEAPGRFLGTRWIISQWDDLTWFVGTALVGYLALVLMSAGVSVTLLTAVWILGVDCRHGPAAVPGPGFDRQQCRRLASLRRALLGIKISSRHRCGDV